jgi:hypothetical protein
MKTLSPVAPRAANRFWGNDEAIGPAGVIRLGPRDVRAFDAAETASINCADGAVWITQDGLAEDVVLYPGEQFAPQPLGKVVVQPLTPAATIAVKFRA